MIVPSIFRLLTPLSVVPRGITGKIPVRNTMHCLPSPVEIGNSRVYKTGDKQLFYHCLYKDVSIFVNFSSNFLHAFLRPQGSIWTKNPTTNSAKTTPLLKRRLKIALCTVSWKFEL